MVLDLGMDLFGMEIFGITGEEFNSEYPKSTSLALKGDLVMLEQNFRNKLSQTQTLIFVSVTLMLMVVSVVGNTATIIVAYWRKHRLFYKSCLVSLAFSDLFLTLVTCTNNLSRFEQTYADWILGDFMCSFIPLVQTTCVLANSMTLCCISIDRYQSVMFAFKTKCEPKLWMCAVGLGIIWIGSTGTSVPMYLSYEQKTMVLYELNATCIITGSFQVQVCVVKEKQFNYLIAVFSVIFLPLLLTFIALHGIIAHHIWRRRAPFAKHHKSGTSSSRVEETPPDVITISSPRIVSTRSHRKPPVEAPRFIFKNQSQIAWNQQSTERSNDSSNQDATKRSKRTVHMERKLRTFKVIIVIMVTFFVCRLPSWILLLIGASPGGITGKQSWLLQYSFSTLSLANSAVNPFLYGLLNETLAVWRDISSWLERHPCTYCFGQEGAKRCFNLSPMCQCNDDDDNDDDKDVNVVVNKETPLPATSTLMIPRSPCNYRDKKETKQGLVNPGAGFEIDSKFGGNYPHDQPIEA